MNHQLSTTLLLLSFLLNLVVGSGKFLDFTRNELKLEEGKEFDSICRDQNFKFCSRSRVEYVENGEDFYTLEEEEGTEGFSIVSTTPPENYFISSALVSDIMKTRNRVKSFDIPIDEILSNDSSFCLNSENLEKYEFNCDVDADGSMHRIDSCSTENEEWEGLNFNCDSNDSCDSLLELEMECKNAQFKKLQPNFNFYAKSRMNKRPSKLLLSIDSISENEKENEEDE